MITSSQVMNSSPRWRAILPMRDFMPPPVGDAGPAARAAPGAPGADGSSPRSPKRRAAARLRPSPAPRCRAAAGRCGRSAAGGRSPSSPGCRLAALEELLSAFWPIDIGPDRVSILEEGRQQRLDRLLGARAPAAQLHERGVHGDPVQPGCEAALAREERLPRKAERKASCTASRASSSLRSTRRATASMRPP